FLAGGEAAARPGRKEWKLGLALRLASPRFDLDHRTRLLSIRRPDEAGLPDGACLPLVAVAQLGHGLESKEMKLGLSRVGGLGHGASSWQCPFWLRAVWDESSGRTKCRNFLEPSSMPDVRCPLLGRGQRC